MKSNKTSSNSAYRKNLKFSLVTYIKENGMLPKHLLKPSALSYHIKQLMSDGIIIKNGYASYSVDWDKWEAKQFKKQVQIQHRGSNDIRGHGFQWYFKPSASYQWDKLRSYIEYLHNKKDQFLDYYFQKKVKGFKLMIRSYKVWFYRDSIIIYTPKDKSFYNYSAKNSYKKALDDVLKVINSIENSFNMDLRIDFRYKIKPSKQHYAHLKNALAEEYNKTTEKLSVKFEGEEWLLVDKSLGVDELETTHSRTSLNDMDQVVKPFFNDLKSHFQKTGESLTVSSLIKLASMQQDQILDLNNKYNSLLMDKDQEKDKPSYFG